MIKVRGGVDLEEHYESETAQDVYILLSLPVDTSCCLKMQHFTFLICAAGEEKIFIMCA